MFSSTTEAVTHLSYGSNPPTVFELTDDLLDPRPSTREPPAVLRFAFGRGMRPTRSTSSIPLVRSRSSARTTEMNLTPIIDMFSGTGELARAVADGLVSNRSPTTTGPPASAQSRRHHLHLHRTHIRPVASARGETEYVLSTMHYFFVWPVKSTIHVQASC